MKNSLSCVPDCLGIPVRYDPDLRQICESRGLWRWKGIVVGPVFQRFPDREKQALLLHEAGHCKLRHLEARTARLWWLLWRPRQLAALCQMQEFEADRYAAGCGYGADLARAFSRLVPGESRWHPPLPERIARLTTTGGS